MTIGSHLQKIHGMDVLQYEESMSILPDLAYAFRGDWNDADGLFTQFNHAKAKASFSRIEGIVFGVYSQEMFEDDTTILVDLVVKYAPLMPNLKVLFFPDLTYEENEISWINQTDVSPVLKALPNLEMLGLRGGTGLSFSHVGHTNLKSLRVETGGLEGRTVRQISELNLPNLERLELWFGVEDYGGNATDDDLDAILSGKAFPKLKYLGIKNAAEINSYLEAMAGAPVFDQIEELDISMGALHGEQAIEALLAMPELKKLKRLNVDDNYIPDSYKPRFEALPCEVVFGEQREDEGDDWYYSSVAE